MCLTSEPSFQPCCLLLKRPSTFKSEIPECTSKFGRGDIFSIFKKYLQHVSKQQGSLQVSQRKVISSLNEKEKNLLMGKWGWVSGLEPGAKTFLGWMSNWKHKTTSGDGEYLVGSVLCCHNFAFSWDHKVRTWPLETCALPSYDGGIHM